MRTARSHQVVHPHAPQPERIRQRAPHPRSPALRLVNHGVAPPRHRTNHAPAPRVVHVQPNNLGRGRAEHKHHTDQPARRSQGNQPHRGRARRPGPDRQTHENLPAQPPVAGQPRPAPPTTRAVQLVMHRREDKREGPTGPNAKEPPGAKPRPPPQAPASRAVRKLRGEPPRTNPRPARPAGRQPVTTRLPRARRSAAPGPRPGSPAAPPRTAAPPKATTLRP